VARYDKEHKQVTRQPILETAARRFKTDGIDGSGVATLMAGAGLTNGAFYAHFTSKDDLVANVVALASEGAVFRCGATAGGRRGPVRRTALSHLRW
jgi:TetR/AcrR family transcriptional regulator, transcriptional repressor for nem operon